MKNIPKERTVIEVPYQLVRCPHSGRYPHNRCPITHLHDYLRDWLKREVRIDEAVKIHFEEESIYEAGFEYHGLTYETSVLYFQERLVQADAIELQKIDQAHGTDRRKGNVIFILFSIVND